jgi:TRAP-type C4-dicarboxylate transport system permease small subunit
MARLVKIFERIEDILNYVSQVCCLLMMFAVTLQVIMRKIFNYSLVGVYTGVELLMVIIVFLSLSYTQRVGAHIRMEFLIMRLRGTVRKIAEAILLFLALIGFSILAWQSVINAVKAFVTGDYEAGIVQFPLWPSKGAVALGAVIICVRFAIDIVCCFVKEDYHLLETQH